MIAAPSSGSGKTVITLGLMRHRSRAGISVAPCKAGPDYIDPAFHAAACGRPCHNLDVWAMRPATLGAVAGLAGADADLVICEGVMGLFDGSGVSDVAAGDGSTADLAVRLGWPVVLIIDAQAQGGSAAAVLRGFASHREDLHLAGVIYNQVGGEGHARLLRKASAASLPDIPVLGCVPADPRLKLPHRHLGLVQAGERAGLDRFLDAAADIVGTSVDTARLRDIAAAGGTAATSGTPWPTAIPPLGQHIAVASDLAFAFVYASVLEGWRAAGATVSLFSPLADEAPPADADAVYLPGGYPELEAGRLAAAHSFLDGLRDAAGRGAAIYGECGGYMVLGTALTDGEGRRHEMAGLLPVETSFAKPRPCIGYRRLRLVGAGPLGAAGAEFRGHEFHHATVVREDRGAPLFHGAVAAGHELGTMGQVAGRVAGSFAHLIDRA